MKKTGFIILNRSFMDWQWYDEPRTLKLFLHLLFTVNFKDNDWHGIKVRRGQRVVSLQGLADETDIPKSTLIDILGRLEKSGDIEREPTAKFTIITVKDYEKYLSQGTDNDFLLSACRPQSDSEPNQINNYNKNKNYNKNNNHARVNETRKPSFDINELEAMAMARYIKSPVPTHSSS